MIYLHVKFETDQNLYMDPQPMQIHVLMLSFLFLPARIFIQAQSLHKHR